ncbi:MAG TPA: type II secretion system protein GspM [Pseudolabrys sp.]
MLALKRDQIVALGILAAVTIVCIGGLGASLTTRYEALSDNADKQTLLADIEARVRRDARTSGRRTIGEAPASAFLNAPTQGAAGAQLEAYLTQVSDRRAVLISSAVHAADKEDAPDMIRVEATLDVSAAALQEMLYRLEMGEPYVFIDSLQVRVAGRVAGRDAEDPLLRVTLNLHAIWRHGSI